MLLPSAQSNVIKGINEYKWSMDIGSNPVIWKSKVNGQKRQVPHKQTFIITIRYFELFKSLTKPIIRTYLEIKFKKKQLK